MCACVRAKNRNADEKRAFRAHRRINPLTLTSFVASHTPFVLPLSRPLTCCTVPRLRRRPRGRMSAFCIVFSSPPSVSFSIALRLSVRGRCPRCVCGRPCCAFFPELRGAGLFAPAAAYPLHRATKQEWTVLEVPLGRSGACVGGTAGSGPAAGPFLLWEGARRSAHDIRWLCWPP